MKLQIFVPDVSAEASDFARNRVYPEPITPMCRRSLQRFSAPGSRLPVSRELRARPLCSPITTVFTDHDLLGDPSFSRIDLVSCRNLAIYLQPEEQRKVPSMVSLRAARCRLSVSRRRLDDRPTDRVFRAGFRYTADFPQYWPAQPAELAEAGTAATVFIVDDDPGVRDSMRECC